MSKEKQIELLEKQLAFWKHHAASLSKAIDGAEETANHYAEMLDKTEEELNTERVKRGWISVDDRLPTEDEYLTHHNDGLDTLKRLLIAYQTDTIEYQIGCYDGWKWMNQLGNRVVKGVVAWKPFEAYELPKMKGGAE